MSDCFRSDLIIIDKVDHSFHEKYDVRFKGCLIQYINFYNGLNITNF
jgi:hypothetical protein